MRTFDQETEDYLVYILGERIEMFLDDPYGYSRNTADIKEYVEKLTRVCKTMDIDFWKYVTSNCRRNEVDRLMAIIGA